MGAAWVFLAIVGFLLALLWAVWREGGGER